MLFMHSSVLTVPQQLGANLDVIPMCRTFGSGRRTALLKTVIIGAGTLLDPDCHSIQSDAVLLDTAF